MLTYADAQVSALRDRIMHNAEMKCISGTHFTCFTSTKVQILTLLGAPLHGRMLLTLAHVC